MKPVIAKRTIRAPAELVFDVISNVAELSRVDADVIGVEFLTESRAGVGTRFRETRRMKNREHRTELEVAEYDPPDRVRMVADTNGTVWDTLFTVDERDGKSTLTIRMDCRAHGLLPKILNPLMKGVFAKGIEGHLDKVKAFCEDRH